MAATSLVVSAAGAAPHSRQTFPGDKRHHHETGDRIGPPPPCRGDEQAKTSDEEQDARLPHRMNLTALT